MDKLLETYHFVTQSRNAVENSDYLEEEKDKGCHAWMMFQIVYILLNPNALVVQSKSTLLFFIIY